MALRDHLRHTRQGGYQAPAAYTGDFWGQVRGLCRTHVEQTIGFFRSKEAPLLDWAEPRFMQLAEDEPLDALMAAAGEALTQFPDSGRVIPGPVGIVGAWAVFVSVRPADSDAGFLRECPGQCFEDLALIGRQHFRALLPEVWRRANYAHWILLVDVSAPSASVHLHTVWSLDQHLVWMKPAIEGVSTVVVAAPDIVPVDLLHQDFYEFSRRLLLADFECARAEDAAGRG